MCNLIKKLPYPVSGLMLALAALGNLLKPRGEIIRYNFGILSALILLLVLIKIIKYPKSFLEVFEQPAIAGIMATLPMGIIILSTYVVSFSNKLGAMIWWLGILIYIIIFGLFIRKTLFPFKIKKIFPSYFVMFVGIVSASVVSPTYKYEYIGQYIFWIGIICYLFWLPIILYRVVKVKEIPEVVMPTIAIFAAPPSLLLAGYNSSFTTKSLFLLNGLTIIALFFYLCALVYVIKFLFKKFMPSYSSFTFPFVISAIALRPFATKYEVFGPVHVFMQIFAVIMVIYVFIEYMKFLLKKTV
ncbi:MAG: TDT family transporter [Filifactoraceae bacterium]